MTRGGLPTQARPPYDSHVLTSSSHPQFSRCRPGLLDSQPWPQLSQLERYRTLRQPFPNAMSIACRKSQIQCVASNMPAMLAVVSSPKVTEGPPVAQATCACTPVMNRADEQWMEGLHQGGSARAIGDWLSQVQEAVQTVTAFQSMRSELLTLAHCQARRHNPIMSLRETVGAMGTPAEWVPHPQLG